MSAGKTVKDDDALEEAMERPGTMLNTQSHRPIAGAERFGPWKSGKTWGLKQPCWSSLFHSGFKQQNGEFWWDPPTGVYLANPRMVALHIPKPGMSIILLLVVGCCCSMSMWLCDTMWYYVILCVSLSLSISIYVQLSLRVCLWSPVPSVSPVPIDSVTDLCNRLPPRTAEFAGFHLAEEPPRQLSGCRDGSIWANLGDWFWWLHLGMVQNWVPQQIGWFMREMAENPRSRSWALTHTIFFTSMGWIQ